MTIRLRPEIERLIQQDVARGPYETADEFVERAVKMLHDQEDWLSSNQAEIREQIEEGYRSAQRGELLDADAIRDQMDEKKRQWRNSQDR